MTGNFHLPPDRQELPIFSDQEGGTLNAEDLLAEEHFALEHAVLAADLAGRVREQGIGQFQFAGELLVRRDAVAANAQDEKAMLLELRVVLAKLASLARSARGVVFGVEEEYHTPPAQSREGDAVAWPGR